MVVGDECGKDLVRDLVERGRWVVDISAVRGHPARVCVISDASEANVPAVSLGLKLLSRPAWPSAGANK